MTLDVVYFNFWANHPPNVEDGFHQHLIIITIPSYVLCKVGKDGILMKGFLDGHELDMQCSYFKMTMVTNSEAIIKCVSFVNLII
jgi:hypothetical protein